MERVRRNPVYRVVRQLVERYFEDNVGRSSAELAYYLLFSLFPVLMFLNAAISLFQFSPAELLSEIGVVLPVEVVQLITSYVDYISTLSAQPLVYASIILTLFSVSRSVNSLTHAVNRAYRMEKSGFFGLLLAVLMAFLLLISVYLLLFLLVISKNLLHTVLNYVHLPVNIVAVWDFLRFTIAPFYLFLVITCFYYIVSRRRYPFWRAMPGAAFFILIGLAVSVGFSFYVENMSRYSLIYGSIGAIMILMLWLYIIGALLILGGHLNHVLISERNARLDSRK